jgi:hypothetical protein
MKQFDTLIDRVVKNVETFVICYDPGKVRILAELAPVGPMGRTIRL